MYSDHQIWEPLYQNLLSADHSYHWKAYAVGAEPQFGVLRMGKWNGTDASFNSVYDNADQLAKYVKHAQLDSNAWHVDMVAHSTGGLVARLYLHKLMPNVPDARPQVKHLIMLGTPNGGVPCIDVFVGKLGMFKHDQRPLQELTNASMLDFNKYVVNTGGAKLSALAGNPVPLVCGGFEWNDGFVTVRSAKFGVSDTGESNDLNYQLVDAKNFGNFVLPHLITGPKGTYPLPVKNDPTDWRRWQLATQNYDVNNTSGSLGGSPWMQPADTSYASIFGIDGPGIRAGGPNASAGDTQANTVAQTFAKELTVGPKQSVLIDLPVAAAPNLGLTFIAQPGVSVSLLNEQGVLVSRDPGDSPFANVMFRTVLTRRPVTDSVWKLKIENTTQAEQSFAGFSWSMADLPVPAIGSAKNK